MKKVIIIGLLFLVGCTPRGCQQFDRAFQFKERNYNIKQFSGGKMIGEYSFYGILNSEEASDGYFFFLKDTLIEVSGDLTIKSWQ